MPQNIQHQVDQLLMEQGQYQPLEYLLQEGRLSYSDYEAWRNGELRYLDEALFGDPQHIHTQLQQAGDYLKKRGWISETINYQCWNGGKTQTLRFSAHQAFNKEFHLSYSKPQDQPQMDLFSDNPATSLSNGIRRALCDRNIDEAQRMLELLYTTAPDHQQLGGLERLVEAAETLSQPVGDAVTEMESLQQTITPLAEALLGNDSRDLLIPLWRRLTKALRNHPYDPSRPDLHQSYAATQSMEWETVRRSVKNEESWYQDATLLQRYAQACDKRHQNFEALQSWFFLCWQFPHQDSALDNCHHNELRQLWRNFLDLEPELATEAFPAWVLLNKPGLSKQLPKPTDSPVMPPESYTILFRLCASETSNGEAAIAERAKLKAQDPVLFGYFLQTQGS